MLKKDLGMRGCEVYAFHLLSPKSQMPSILQEANFPMRRYIHIKARKMAQVKSTYRGPELVPTSYIRLFKMTCDSSSRGIYCPLLASKSNCIQVHVSTHILRKDKMFPSFELVLLIFISE